MKSSRAFDIFDEITPVHFYSKMIGLTAFSIKQNNNRPQSFLSLYNVICSLVVFSWNIYALLEFLVFGSAFNFNRKMLTVFFEKSITVLICIDLTLMIGINFWMLFIRDKVVKLLQEIKTVDEVLSDMKFPINHAKHRKIAFVYILSSQCTNVVIQVSVFLSSQFTEVYQSSFFLSAAELFGTNYFIVFCSHCTFLLLSVFARYRQVNSKLRQLCSEEKSSRQNSIEVTKDETWKRLSSVHDKLVDITTRISFCYGIPVSFNLFKAIRFNPISLHR